jgi:hypothetical protein
MGWDGFVMGTSKKMDEDYPEKEAQERFKAALRGARIAGHVPMKPKETKVAKKKAKKAAKTA